MNREYERLEQIVKESKEQINDSDYCLFAVTNGRYLLALARQLRMAKQLGLGEKVTNKIQNEINLAVAKQERVQSELLKGLPHDHMLRSVPNLTVGRMGSGIINIVNKAKQKKHNNNLMGVNR